MNADREPFPPETLGVAIAAFLGWKVDRRPGSHADAVMRLAPEGHEQSLLSAVKEAIARSDAVRLSDEVWAGTEYGNRLKAALHAQQPDLTDEAVGALASRLAYLQFN
ncbi:hypothetical protein GCM10011575_25340 [Microlunatus endophyticus]|uniref:Uncharacterized protein n=1 Tax=Microlunatus endophyticus TaxID=1716077 RepID=A0A917SB69_9ACTN|nr:hypothetical protein [Microlunatus endophyticus]GGL65872.1 hypothetical protein GCM10011575_25340 [Microlunatus endophyticus]